MRSYFLCTEDYYMHGPESFNPDLAFSKHHAYEAVKRYKLLAGASTIEPPEKGEYLLTDNQGDPHIMTTEHLKEGKFIQITMHQVQF